MSVTSYYVAILQGANGGRERSGPLHVGVLMQGPVRTMMWRGEGCGQHMLEGTDARSLEMSEQGREEGQ